MTTQTYNVQEAKANLSRLLEEVASGAEVIIAKEGKPLARLSRIEESMPKIRFGVLKGKVKVSEDFVRSFSTLPMSLFRPLQSGRSPSKRDSVG